MSREKQIEEMAWNMCDVPKHPSITSCEKCNCHGKCHPMYYAIRAYNAGYRKSEWISVDERLPETDNENRYTFNVLVFIPERKGCRQHGMYLGKLRRVKASDGKDNFWNIQTQECEWTVWGWSYFEHPVVTHWMPLPEAPKGGE